MGSFQQPERNPKEFRVAIVGGGIGGLACALCLTYSVPDLSIDVYEQASEYSEIGAGVSIAVNAARILHIIGVGDQVNAISGDHNHIHRSLRRFDNGDEIVTIPAEYEESDKVRRLCVHRAELLDVLYQEIRARKCATLHTNKKCLHVEDKDEAVRLCFEDGTNASANLVVGADGIHSPIRHQFHPDKPQYSGRIAYRGLAPIKDVESFWPFPSYAVSWLAPNKHFLTFPISANKTLNCVAFVTKSEEDLGDLQESWSSRTERHDLEKEYVGWDPVMLKVLSKIEPMPGKWRLNDHALLDEWVYLDGKVVLLGDAAHAMLPHQGSGAGHAIEDGYILGMALRDFFLHSSEPLSVFTKLYESVRVPRAQRGQATARQAGDVYELQGPEFEGIKNFEDGLPIIRQKMTGRMKWFWGADIKEDYVQARAKAGVLGGKHDPS
ncbi:MAG: hypothetical protein Q9227_001268 [Pyrenula ochraceoflavens]